MGAYRHEPIKENFEKRKIPRFPVQLPIVLAHQEDDSSICTSLSSEGVSVETPKNFQVSKRVFVEVVLAPTLAPLRMQGQVVWRKQMQVTNNRLEPMFELGIRFIRSMNVPWKKHMGNLPFDEMFDFGMEQEDELSDFIPPFTSRYTPW